jgi:hypothetical protein
VGDLVGDADHRRGQVGGAIGLQHRQRNVGDHAAELLEEVDVEIGAAELSVGNRLQAHVLLELDDLGNRLVFNRAQLLGRDLAFGLLFARLQQVSGAQKAADMVVTGGELGGHGRVSEF